MAASLACSACKAMAAALACLASACLASACLAFKAMAAVLALLACFSLACKDIAAALACLTFEDMAGKVWNDDRMFRLEAYRRMEKKKSVVWGGGRSP